MQFSLSFFLSILFVKSILNWNNIQNFQNEQVEKFTVKVLLAYNFKETRNVLTGTKTFVVHNFKVHLNSKVIFRENFCLLFCHYFYYHGSKIKEIKSIFPIEDRKEGEIRKQPARHRKKWIKSIKVN